MRKTQCASRRALFYSHDTLGLGHLRRTLLLAQRLHERLDNLNTLVLTGSAMAHGFRIEPSIDYVKLPSVQKVGDESYASRTLDTPFDHVLEMRQELILTTARTYRPDMLFVDNVPLGMKGEMVGTLRDIRANNPTCRIILTLRDVIDAPDRVIPLWQKLGVFDALEHYYDAICVYGHRQVYDVAEEYNFPRNIREKTHYCGYLPRLVDARARADVRRGLGLHDGENLVVATVGGGSDGANVIEAFLKALPLLSRHNTRGIVLLGPDMEAGQRASFRDFSQNSDVRLMDFTPEPLPLFSAADAIVSMGGYNTVSEILALEKRAVVVPRVEPRVEQLLRCQRLKRMNLLRMVHPAQLTPERLAGELDEALSQPPPFRDPRIVFSGLDELLRVLGEPQRPHAEADIEMPVAIGDHR